MKKLIIFFALVMGQVGIWAQQDTLHIEDPRKLADTIYGLLDESKHEGKLMDRTFTMFETTTEQRTSNYNQIHDIVTFLEIYSDVAFSYTDSTKLMNNQILVDSIYKIFADYDGMDSTDVLNQPFGLVLHNMNQIKIGTMDSAHFTNSNSQLNPTYSQDSLYESVIIKCATLMEFNSDNGYDEGFINYNSNFITTSDDITKLNIQLNMGNGYQPFNVIDNKILYERSADSLIGFAALSYEFYGRNIKDTLKFYVTKETGNSNLTRRDEDNWDYEKTYYTSYGTVYAGIKMGCGSVQDHIRRPIIISVPYRPSVQKFKLSKYYDQFNFKSLFISLSDMGYDVILLRPETGNNYLELAGKQLAQMITTINQLKAFYYPNENWENTVMGFSMGGQVAKYALKYMEKRHMDFGEPHHHSRLYVSFDSPHNGANIPLFAQTVYQYLGFSGNIFAMLSYGAVMDPASSGMAVSHIAASPKVELSTNNFQIQPQERSHRTNFINALHNDFQHQYSNNSDLRKPFPSFTRNVAVSVGRSDANYTSEYNLTPGKQLYYNDLFIPYLGGLLQSDCQLHASKYSSNASLFRLKRKLFIAYIFPVTLSNKRFTTKDAYEWDMAQGGYKDEFFDGTKIGVIPIGVVPLLRYMALGFGHKEYNRHMNFMPLVSALAINPSIWQNNNLFYNVKDQRLMFNIFDFQVGVDESDKFGYPNLGHPTDHFNITPFEAVYCDIQTYEHIKMQQSITDAQNDNDNTTNLDDVYLVHTRNFILDEVEADNVFLQNKIIGQNHQTTVPIYKYRAWYQAYTSITFGKYVTPKTDFGDYIIEKTGDITAYAGQEIYLLDGFYAQDGSDFYAYIKTPTCTRPRMMKNYGSGGEEDEEDIPIYDPSSNENITEHLIENIKVYPNPNSGQFTIEIPEEFIGGKIVIRDLLGKKILESIATNARIIITDNFAQGTYIISVYRESRNKVLQTKITVL